jgi:thioredoxin reductase
MLQWSESVTIFVHGHDRDLGKKEMSKLLAEGVPVMNEKVTGLEGEPEHLRNVILQTGERVPIEALFFTIGVEPSTNLAQQLGCKGVDDTPCLEVDDFKETTVKGVYAIGDLAPGSQLAITSAADGAVAAVAINNSLLPPSRRV